jgi:hypothetical protein
MAKMPPMAQIPVTSNQIRAAISAAEQQRDLAKGLFAGSLKAFPGKQESDPLVIATEIGACERRIAALQTVLARYNLLVEVSFEGRQVPVAEAVKLLGGLERLEALWQSALAVRKEDPYGRDESRDPKLSYQEPTVPAARAAIEVSGYGTMRRGLAAALKDANSTRITLDFDPALLGPVT